MALLTLTATRKGDEKPTTWFFDSTTEWHAARRAAQERGVPYSYGEDYITDSDEFTEWLEGKS